MGTLSRPRSCDDIPRHLALEDMVVAHSGRIVVVDHRRPETTVTREKDALTNLSPDKVDIDE